MQNDGELGVMTMTSCASGAFPHDAYVQALIVEHSGSSSW